MNRAWWLILSLGSLLAGCSQESPGSPLDGALPDALAPDAPGPAPAPSLAAQLPTWAVVVPMEVGSAGTAQLLLDTGADVLRLSPAMAAKVGASPLASITFGQTTHKAMPFSIYDTGQASGLLGVELDGIAGNKLFSGLVVAVDYRLARVYPLAAWRNDYNFGGHTKGALVQVPFTLGGPTGLIVAQGRFESLGKDTGVVLDTGTSSAVISQSLFKALGADTDGRVVLHGSKAVSSFGNIDSPILRLRSFRLGAAHSAARMWATVLPDLLFQALSVQAGAKVDAIIGGSYLRETLVAMDYPKKTLYLAPYLSMDHIGVEFQQAGVEVQSRAGKFSIFSVFKGSDAEKKGVKVDDELDKVDSQDVKGLTLAKVRALLAGTPKSMVSVTLSSSAGGVRTVTVMREDLLPLLN